MNSNTISDDKKRIMFIKGEDFYFLTYNILLILKALNCNSEDRTFKDYRKLAFLIDFVSNWNILNILLANVNGKHLNYADRETLTRSYSSGMLRMNEIIKLLFALEKKELLHLVKNRSNGHLDIYLNDKPLPSDLFDKDLFKIELNNINLLKANISRLSTLKLETLLERLYYNYGITKWVTY